MDESVSDQRFGDSPVPRAEVGETRDDEVVKSKPFPLNSRRLGSSILRQVAVELGLPGTGSLEDTHQMIDGRLQEQEHEPCNVQVRIMEPEGEVPGLTVIELKDAESIFLRTELPADEPERSDSEDSSAGERSTAGAGEEQINSEGVEQLQAELMEARAQTEEEQSRREEVETHNSRLQEEVRELSVKLEQSKNRIKQLWKVNCSQLTEFELILAEHEEERATLKCRLPPRGDGTVPPLDGLTTSPPHVTSMVPVSLTVPTTTTPGSTVTPASMTTPTTAVHSVLSSMTVPAPTVTLTSVLPSASVSTPVTSVSCRQVQVYLRQ